MRLIVKRVETAYIRYRCCICDEETNKDRVQAAAFDEDGDEQGKVCEDCLLSRDTLIARARAHAAELRRVADVLDTLTIEKMVTAEQRNGGRG